MFGVVFSVAFVVIALLAMLIGALKAKKKAWQFSVVRMVQTAFSALLGALLSSLISWFSVKALLSLLPLGEIGNMINDFPSVMDAVTAIAAMLIAPVIFLPVYAIIKAIARIFTKMLTRLLIKWTASKEKKKPADVSESEEKGDAQEYYEKLQSDSKEKKAKKEFELSRSNWISALCGAACGLITLCVLATPVVGTLEVVDGVISMPLHSAAAEDGSEGSEMVADIVDASANNAGTVTVKVLGGGVVYDIMTSHNVGGRIATFRHEATAIKALTNAFSAHPSDSNQTKAARVREIPKAFKKSVIFPVLLSELASGATDAWESGDAFYGMEKPDFGEELNPLMMSTIGCFADSNVDTIKEDVYTVSDVIAVLIEKDSFDEFYEDPISLFKNEETMSGVFFDLLENERLHVLVDGLSDLGISALLNNMGVPKNTADLYPELIAEIGLVYGANEEELAQSYADIFDRYGLRVSVEICAQAAKEYISGGDIFAWIAENVVAGRQDFVEKTEIVCINDIIGGRNFVADRRNESQRMAHAFSVMSGIKDDLSGDVENTIHLTGPMLESFAATETIGREKADLILKALLQSNTVHESVGMTVIEADDTADDMAESAIVKGYVPVMNSLEKIVAVFNAAADDGKDTRVAVRELLADLTPDNANMISNVTTPNVVTNYGARPESAKPISVLISDTFTNLAATKEQGISDEEYEKEALAVSDMMNVLMATNVSGKSTFGEGSKTGTSAAEFVDNMMDSTVTVGTVVDKVYGDGDQPALDPMLTESVMEENERAEFIEALNNRYQNSDKTEQTEREIISVASLMNVEVCIVDGAVVLANTPVTLPA